SDGQNFSPRHEIEYCPQAHVHTHPDPAGGPDKVLLRPGRYSSSPGQRSLHAAFGCLACASFTPWQIMAGNAAPYSPLDILADVEKGAEAVVAHINRLAHNHPGATLEYWAHLWNGQPSAKYVADLLHAYQAGIPEVAP
ncbi:MAG TPA: hypothetical protein VKU44_06820, partial [Terriglobia bacterium]|nr:hypothetical protein [Terriglobia bacterium]